MLRERTLEIKMDHLVFVIFIGEMRECLQCREAEVLAIRGLIKIVSRHRDPTTPGLGSPDGTVK